MFLNCSYQEGHLGICQTLREQSHVRYNFGKSRIYFERSLLSDHLQVQAVNENQANFQLQTV